MKRYTRELCLKRSGFDLGAIGLPFLAPSAPSVPVGRVAHVLRDRPVFLPLPELPRVTGHSTSWLQQMEVFVIPG